MLPVWKIKMESFHKWKVLRSKTPCSSWKQGARQLYCFLFCVNSLFYNIESMSYDNFAVTFSNSRKNLHWPELDSIILDMRNQGYKSVLDIGCGNGRFLEQLTVESEKWIMWEKFQYLGVDSSEWMITEARKLHPEYHFEVIDMINIGDIVSENLQFDALIFLASFHHLESLEERIKVLQDARKLLAPWGRIYMTNWNLREIEKYEKSHQGNGDYAIKIGEFSRYYHGFTTEELAGLFEEAGYRIVENRVFEWGRNILSVVE